MNAENYTKWVTDKGDSTLRLDYPLNKESIVFDLGAYKGHFADQIYAKYKCKVFAFEPIPSFYKLLENKYACNSKVFVFNLAIIGTTDKQKLFVVDNDQSGSFIEGKNKVLVECCRLGEVMYCLMVEHIDLIKINIEGGEYALLKYMIDNRLVQICANIQVQFHTFVNLYEEKYEWIKEKLSETHELTYRYPFVWENWRRKE